jgi:hypothetical protein
MRKLDYGRGGLDANPYALRVAVLHVEMANEIPSQDHGGMK